RARRRQGQLRAQAERRVAAAGRSPHPVAPDASRPGPAVRWISVHWVPLVASFVAAAAITPTTVRGLAAQGHLRENYRGESVAFPAGIALLTPAVVALGFVAVLFQFKVDVLEPEFGFALVYVLGIGFLGLLDDFLGSATDQPRGWRQH